VGDWLDNKRTGQGMLRWSPARGGGCYKGGFVDNQVGEFRLLIFLVYLFFFFFFFDFYLCSLTGGASLRFAAFGTMATG
jgi:hypothetical protein